MPQSTCDMFACTLWASLTLVAGPQAHGSDPTHLPHRPPRALHPARPRSPLFLLTAYTLGGTLNQNTFLAIHEITHNLAFRSIRANKLLAIVANFAIGVPYAMAFKGYHIEHHKFLGEDGIDTDLPSRIEAIVLNNVAGKTFFA
jgi:sphingolipid delta-4 desaturase